MITPADLDWIVVVSVLGIVVVIVLACIWPRAAKRS